jgi:hypothetical protein
MLTGHYPASVEQSLHESMRPRASGPGLDHHITAAVLRVTALTTARQRGWNIIASQDFAAPIDPRMILTSIRSGDRLSKSPALRAE